MRALLIHRSPWPLALLALALLLLAGGGRAHAHAALLHAAPHEQQTFRLARPAEVRLTFGDELRDSTTIRVLRERDAQEMQQGATQIDPADPHIAFVALPPLEPGRYTVIWQSYGFDNEPTVGQYAFTISPRAPYLALIGGGLLLVLLAAFLLRLRRRADAAPA